MAGANDFDQYAKRVAGFSRTVHEAVKTLPAPQGLSKVSFKVEPVERHEDPKTSWQEGEVRHQTALAPSPTKLNNFKDLDLNVVLGLAKPRPPSPPPFVPPLQQPGATYTKEQMKEWGYPEYDPNFDDPEWLRAQFRKEREDPRENPNFFLTDKDPEFWNNAARKPYNRALMRSEEHWEKRKNTWLQQFQTVQEFNKYRQEVSEKLEDCSIETKRLVTPVLQHRVVQHFLVQVAKDAKERGVPFEQLVETAENRARLRTFRSTADVEGEKGAVQLFLETEAYNQRYNIELTAKEEQKLKIDRSARRVVTMEELRISLGIGHRCRKDGLIEWEKGQHMEALIAWRKGRDELGKIRAPDTHEAEKKEFDEIHISLLKNLSQAALKLGFWNEALEAADLALQIDVQDHKAWFRRACALEGLGRFKEVEPCLEQIDIISVGRPDCDRLQKDTQAKRSAVQKLINTEEAAYRRMIEKGLQMSLFSEQRDKQERLPEPRGPPAISHKVKVKKLDDKSRKRLTRDGAEDILKDLSNAYSDQTFRGQVRKLASDVTDVAEFICYLTRVALPVQAPVLEKWGFEASELGVTEMRRAVQDHTRGPSADLRLRAQAEETMRALYGEFYEVARAYGLSPEERAKVPEPSRKPRACGSGEASLLDSSEDETENKDSKLYSHWSERPRATYDDQRGAPALPQAASGGAVASGLRAGDLDRSSRSPKDLLAEDAAKDSSAFQPQSRSSSRAGTDADSNKAPPQAAGEARPKLDRKVVWAELSKAQADANPKVLRMAIDKALEAGFSAVTIRSAKQRLQSIGGDMTGL